MLLGSIKGKRNIAGLKLLLCAELFAFFVLWVTINPVRLGIVSFFLLVSCWVVVKNHTIRFSSDFRVVSLQIAIFLVSAVRFYEYWLTSTKVEEICEKLFSTDAGVFLSAFAISVGLISFFGLNVLIQAVLNVRLFSAIRSWFGKHLILSSFLSLLVLSFVQFLQMQRSSLDYFPNIFKIRIPYLMVNLAALFFLNLVSVALVRKRRVSALCLSTFLTIFCIVNYFVIVFHGSPFFPSELRNTKTAVNVISGYNFTLSPQIVDIVALFFFAIVVSSSFPSAKFNAKECKRVAEALVCSLAVVFVGFFSPIALKNTWQFSWKASVMYGGFVFSSINDIKTSIHPVHRPEAYDPELISVQKVNNTDVITEYPDIILILNESFCDLSVYSETGADQHVFSDFYALENAVHGIAFSPDVGGGTNDSEFELLTSHSMTLMASSAPFNYLKFNEKNSTLLTYLHSLGYSTTAMHNSTPYNYSRHIAFPAMGFDRVYLGENSFSKTSYNGNRPVLDEDDYAGLISVYEQETEGPRFFYLLTYQNHGGWEQNDASYDTIHISKDFGALTDDVEEYLSSVALSVNAFQKMTEYFMESDRPVVICMVGDHAPSLISQLNANRDLTPEEDELWKRAVPFVIWSNFEYYKNPDRVYCSMTDLIPILLSDLNMPLTPYYQQILTVRETIPVRTRFRICMDNRGIVFQNDEASMNDALRQYYFMEYNGVIAGEDYRSELFRVAKN